MGFFNRKRKLREEFNISKWAHLFRHQGNVNGDPLYNSAYWACIMNLAKMYATLPLHAYRSNGTQAVKLDKEHYLNKLMRKPNSFMTSYQFWFVMGINLEMHGQAFAIKDRAPNGVVRALYPVSPNSLIKYADENEMYYVMGVSGTRYNKDDILEISGTPSGYASVLSPITYASDTIDLEKKVKAMQNDYLDGASVIGNVITVPRQVDDEGMAKVKAMFDSAHGFKNYVVKEGMNVTPIHVNSGDIGKLTEASTWSAKDIARRFQVPPFFIGETSGTLVNAEQQGLEMVTYCIGPRVRAIEVALDDALCEKGEYYRFSLQGLLRGDHASRSAFYHNAIMDGWMSINDVRGLEELSPVDYGDEHFFPMNYATIKDIAEGKFANNGSPWDLPAEEEAKHTDTPKKELTEAERLAEKKKKDMLFMEESSKPVKTSRAKLEKMIRKQLKAEIAELQRLIAVGGNTEGIMAEWTEWLNTYAAELAPQYRAVYADVIRRMLPRVRKEAESDIEVEDERIEGFAGEYADSLMKRHAGHVHNRVQGVIGTENFDEAMDNLQTEYPAIESKEEVNRSYNAFNVFLFGALGVEYMHSVANADACSFCAKLDGKVCSVDGYMLDKGAEMEDSDGNLRHIKKNYRHPPYHSSCSCFVAPGK